MSNSISREAVLNKIAEIDKLSKTGKTDEALALMKECFESLTPKQTEWISVKKHGNPKEDDDYWVAFVEVEDYDTDDKWIETDIDSFCVKTQMWSHHNNADDKVIAWMPLPSPYKGDEE